MAQAGRRGDRAHLPHDDHGGPCCPHAAQGPALTGSVNVLINRRPMLRVGDRGMHSHCCDSNTWTAYSGALCVLVNDRRPHRLGDLTDHCGGEGLLIEGSPNVLIGDWKVPTHGRARELHVALFDYAGRLIPGVAFEVTGPVTFSGTTQAEIVVFKDLPKGKYTVKFDTIRGVLPYGPSRRLTHGTR